MSSQTQKLYVLSDTDLVYEPAKLRNGTIVSTGAITGKVYDSDDAQIGGDVELTYDATLKEWRGVFHDPGIGDGSAAGIVDGASYYITYTLAGSGAFSGVDDYRKVWAVGTVRGVGP